MNNEQQRKQQEQQQLQKQQADLNRAMSNMAGILISFCAFVGGIFALCMLGWINWLVPLPLNWNISTAVSAVICIVGSHIYCTRLGYSGKSNSPIIHQILASGLGLAFVGGVAFFPSMWIVNDCAKKLTNDADQQFVSGNYSGALAGYNSVGRAHGPLATFESESRQARNLEKIGLTHVMLSEDSRAVENLNAALRDRVDIFSHADPEYDSIRTVRERQILYIARLETNLGQIAKRHNLVKQAQADELALIEKLAAFEHGFYIPGYFAARLDSLARVGDDDAGKEVLALAHRLKITPDEGDDGVEPNAWMEKHHLDVGGSTKKIALFDADSLRN